MKQTIKKDYRVRRITELASQGKTRKEICADLGIKLTSLHNYCYQYGIQLPTDNSINASRRKALIREYTDKGYSRDEIAKALNLKTYILESWAHHNNVLLPRSSFRINVNKKDHVMLQACIPTDVADSLVKQADDRKMSVLVFASSILSAVAEGKLYQAVLE